MIRSTAFLTRLDVRPSKVQISFGKPVFRYFALQIYGYFLNSSFLKHHYEPLAFSNLNQHTTNDRNLFIIHRKKKKKKKKKKIDMSSRHFLLKWNCHQSLSNFLQQNFFPYKGSRFFVFPFGVDTFSEASQHNLS